MALVHAELTGARRALMNTYAQNPKIPKPDNIKMKNRKRTVVRRPKAGVR